jgi:hypothetical protein
MPRGLKRLLFACAVASLIGGCAPSTPPEAQVRLPLEEADILAAVFRSALVPITVDPFCAGIAAPDTHTIGRFVADLLAAHERSRSNAIRIWTDSENPSAETVDVLFISEAGEEDSLIWGVKFAFASGDKRLIDPDSMRCFTSWFP